MTSVETKESLITRTACVVTRMCGIHAVSNSIAASSYCLRPSRMDEFTIIQASFIGRKSLLQDFFTMLRKGESIFLQRPGITVNSNYDKLSYQKATLERNGEEPFLSMIKPINGSLFCEGVIAVDRVRPYAVNGDSDCFYMVGKTLEDARARFADFMSQVPLPIEPSWENALWDAMSRQGWIHELSCFRSAGYTVQFEREDLDKLIREMWRNGQLDRTFMTGEPLLTLSAAA